MTMEMKIHLFEEKRALIGLIIARAGSSIVTKAFLRWKIESINTERLINKDEAVKRLTKSIKIMIFKKMFKAFTIWNIS